MTSLTFPSVIPRASSVGVAGLQPGQQWLVVVHRKKKRTMCGNGSIECEEKISGIFEPLPCGLRIHPSLRPMDGAARRERSTIMQRSKFFALAAGALMIGGAVAAPIMSGSVSASTKRFHFVFTESTTEFHFIDAPASAPADGQAGDTITFEAANDEPLDVMLLGGQPIGEPVEQYGPFVMNTRAELQQAFDDYQKGRLGTVPANGIQPFRGR